MKLLLVRSFWAGVYKWKPSVRHFTIARTFIMLYCWYYLIVGGNKEHLVTPPPTPPQIGKCAVLISVTFTIQALCVLRTGHWPIRTGRVRRKNIYLFANHTEILIKFAYFTRRSSIFLFLVLIRWRTLLNVYTKVLIACWVSAWPDPLVLNQQLELVPNSIRLQRRS